jgi:hypothetical protein
MVVPGQITATVNLEDELLSGESLRPGTTDARDGSGTGGASAPAVSSRHIGLVARMSDWEPVHSEQQLKEFCSNGTANDIRARCNHLRRGLRSSQRPWILIEDIDHLFGLDGFLADEAIGNGFLPADRQELASILRGRGVAD